MAKYIPLLLVAIFDGSTCKERLVSMGFDQHEVKYAVLRRSTFSDGWFCTGGVACELALSLSPLGGGFRPDDAEETEGDKEAVVLRMKGLIGGDEDIACWDGRRVLLRVEVLRPPLPLLGVDEDNPCAPLPPPDDEGLLWVLEGILGFVWIS
eukprot:3216429-Ditylum_brightwellii.AAC.1